MAKLRILHFAVHHQVEEDEAIVIYVKFICDAACQKLLNSAIVLCSCSQNKSYFCLGQPS